MTSAILVAELWEHGSTAPIKNVGHIMEPTIGWHTQARFMGKSKHHIIFVCLLSKPGQIHLRLLGDRGSAIAIVCSIVMSVIPFPGSQPARIS